MLTKEDLAEIALLLEGQKIGIMTETRALLSEQKQDIMAETRGLLSEQKQDIMAETRELLREQKQELVHEMNVLIENEVSPKFSLLAESQQVILEKMPSEEDLNIMDSRISTLEIIVKKLSKEVAALKRAN